MPRKVVVVQCPLEDDETIQDLCSVRDLRPRNRCEPIFAMVSRYRFIQCCGTVTINYSSGSGSLFIQTIKSS
jgi:hypothetical protein